MWTSELTPKLFGCGVDAERIDRLEHLVGQSHPWPLVFTPAEIAHSHCLANPAMGLCASFCCKEATFKAIKIPMNFIDCQLYFEPRSSQQMLHLAPRLRQEHGIVSESLWISARADGEMLAVVHLFGGA